jgi:hypothetical protein
MGDTLRDVTRSKERVGVVRFGSASSIDETVRETAPHSRGVAPLDAGRVIAWSWLVSGASIGVLNQVHEGLHEHHELPPLVHWLRDASLAVPLAAIAVMAAALVVRTRVRPGAAGSRPSGRSSIASRITWAILAALFFALLSIPGNQLHGLLFGAELESGSWLADALTDGSIVLVVSLIALAPAALIGGPPWRVGRPSIHPTTTPGQMRTASPGPSAYLAIAGSTNAGGDR